MCLGPTMDTLSLRVEKVPWPDPKRSSRGVKIFVNGNDLKGLVQRVELPFAEAEGHPQIAGGYMELRPKDVFAPSRRLLGEPVAGEELWENEEKVALYACVGCGMVECWPLWVKIVVAPTKVTWSDFEQPHRSTRSKGGGWDLSGLGPFTFDRAQYEAQLIRAPPNTKRRVGK